MSCLPPHPDCAKEHYCSFHIPKAIQKFTLQCSALNEFVHQGKPFDKESLASSLLLTKGGGFFAMYLFTSHHLVSIPCD